MVFKIAGDCPLGLVASFMYARGCWSRKCWGGASYPGGLDSRMHNIYCIKTRGWTRTLEGKAINERSPKFLQYYNIFSEKEMLCFTHATTISRNKKFPQVAILCFKITTSYFERKMKSFCFKFVQLVNMQKILTEPHAHLGWALCCETLQQPAYPLNVWHWNIELYL